MTALEQIDFGLGAAQQEQQLRSYFYRSGAFNLACSEKTYLVLGAKGAGKSAIFRMLQELEKEIPLFRSPNLFVADEPQLRDHWATLQRAGISSKITLWRFYAASLIAKTCLEHEKLPEKLRKEYGRFLVRWGLVREIPTGWQAVRLLKVSVGLGEFLKSEIPPKIPLAVTEIDYVIFSANTWLEEVGANLWLGLDSLDEVAVNGSDHDEVEDLLSNLMRAVAELIRLKRIRFKLFFRTDIYHALTYVNKDHFSALKLELQWSREDLAILLGHRVWSLHSDHQGPLTFSVAAAWIDQVFDWPETPRSFDDLYELLKNGNGDVIPRDLINFCISAQKAQLNFDIQGINPPANSRLVGKLALNRALRETAASKLQDFLQVFQNFRDTYDQLKGSLTREFDRKSLAKALGKTDPLDAQLVLSDLVRVGAVAIKDRKAVNLADSFEIPFLYALALEIGDSNERN